MQSIDFQQPPKLAPKRADVTRRKENIESETLAVNWQNTLLDGYPQRDIFIGDKAVYKVHVGMGVLELTTVLRADEDIVRMLGARQWQKIDQIL